MSDVQDLLTAFSGLSLTNPSYSPLLQLPAEIRNRVYDFVFEPATVNLHKSVALPVEAPSHDQLRTTSLALTQTCRLLRVETLSLYHKAVVSRLDFQDVEEYCDAVFPPSYQLHGRIVAKLDYGSDSPGAKFDKHFRTPELLPIIEIMRVKPRLQITVDLPDGPSKKERKNELVYRTNITLHPDNREKWYWFCKWCVVSIIVRQHQLVVRIELKEPSIEGQWVPWYSMRHFRRYVDDQSLLIKGVSQDPLNQPLLAWLEKVGLGHKISVFGYTIV